MSHFTRDCSTRTQPERSQKPSAHQLSMRIVESSSELKNIKQQHENTDGMSCEYEYLGSHNKITLTTKMTVKERE